jgi:hypothetical protein
MAERLGLRPSDCGFNSRLSHSRNPCPRRAARSARHPVKVEITGSNPVGDAFLKTARYANRKSGATTAIRGGARTFVILRVRLPPVPLETRVGWALACLGGCNPPASPVPVRAPNRPRRPDWSLPDALKKGNGPFVYRFRTAASHAAKAGSIPARVTRNHLTKWWNRQTRDVQSVVPLGVGVQVSPWSLES